MEASPVVGLDGTVYVGDIYGTFYAINTNGSEVWEYTAVPSAGWIGDAAAVGGDETVYYCDDLQASIYALDTSDNPTSRLRWSFAGDVEGMTAPTIDRDGIIYVGCADGKLYALRPTAAPDDGRVKWSYQTGDAIKSAPAIGQDGSIYVGSDDGYLYALNSSDGSLKWRYDCGDPIRSAPAVAYGSNIVYAKTWSTTAEYLYALNGSTGDLIWSYMSGCSYSPGVDFTSSPAVSLDEKTVYILGDLEDYQLYSIDAATGSANWWYALSDALGTVSSVAIGGDGTLYVGAGPTTSGVSLFAITPGDTSATLLWEYSAGEPMVSSPAIVPYGSLPTQSGTLYVGCNDGYLYCFGR